MPELRSEFLMKLAIEVDPEPQARAAVPYGTRRITVITGGHFEGPRLRGRVVPGACAAWVLVRSDEVVHLEARVTLQTDDGAWIYMTYPGIGAGSPEALAKVNTGRAASPDEYYFRTLPLFETGAEPYAWLNRIVAVGVGERTATGPVYDVFRIL